MVAGQAVEAEPNERGRYWTRAGRRGTRMTAPATLALDDVEALLVHRRPEPWRVRDNGTEARAAVETQHTRSSD